jgi:hypothetical protein
MTYFNELGQARLGWRIPSGPDADATAFITAATITNLTQQSAIDTLVKALKSANIWSKMKAIYPFVGGTAAQHRFNLKDPRTVNAAFYLDFIGGGTHSEMGYQANGTTAYADTYFSLQLLNQNNTHLSLYNTNNYIPNPANASVDMGAYNESGTNPAGAFIASEIVNNLSRARLFFNALDYTATDNRGYYIVNSNSTNTQYFINNVLRAGVTNSGVFPLINKNIFIGALNVLNVNNAIDRAYYFANGLYTFASIGDGLTDAEAAAFYTAVQKYQTTLGRQV